MQTVNFTYPFLTVFFEKLNIFLPIICFNIPFCGHTFDEEGDSMRDLLFYKKIFGEKFHFNINKEDDDDFVKIIDVGNITDYESTILQLGGHLTVPTVELNKNQKIAYYSDPDGCIFALLENDN